MKSGIAVLVSVAICAGVGPAAQANDILKFENKKGTVVFNHKKHEELAQGECKVCHTRPGAIDGFGRAYAHKVCIGCHEPEPGKMEGPTACDGCHS